MLLLIMTVCSLSDPNRCGEARMQFSSEVTPMQCLMQAQPYMAQWVEEHPGRRVASWRCARPEVEGQPI